jgi:hypothetical protein
MNLNEADKNRIIEWLEKKCPQMRCLCCGVGRWVVLDISTLPIGIDLHTTRFHYHAGLPQVSIVCQECGHIVHFSASVIGFKPEPPPPPTGA